MKTTFFFIILMNIAILYGQNKNPSIGGGVGLGSFNGNFPSQTIFGCKLFIELHSPLTVFNKLQLHFSFAQKIEKFLPNSYNYQHYSYFASIGLSGLFKQPLNESVYIEEGIGIIYLNDRSFDDIDSWNLGIIINLNGGIHLNKNVDISLGIDYGLTFNNTNVSYFLLIVKGKYLFEF